LALKQHDGMHGVQCMPIQDGCQVAEGVALAPPDVLKLTMCGCATDQPCATARCTCATVELFCTIFCGCHGMEECCNRWTKMAITTEDRNSDVEDVTFSDD